MKASLALIAAALGLAGCADTMLSDNRIRGETAIALGVQPEAVLIADRRYDGLTNTYYTAKTGRAPLQLRHQRRRGARDGHDQSARLPAALGWRAMAETKAARLRDDVAMMKNFHDSAKGLAEHKRQMADAAAPYRVVYASGPEGQAIGKAYMESHRSSYRAVLSPTRAEHGSVAVPRTAQRRPCPSRRRASAGGADCQPAAVAAHGRRRAHLVDQGQHGRRIDLSRRAGFLSITAALRCVCHLPVVAFMHVRRRCGRGAGAVAGVLPPLRRLSAPPERWRWGLTVWLPPVDAGGARRDTFLLTVLMRRALSAASVCRNDRLKDDLALVDPRHRPVAAAIAGRGLGCPRVVDA